MIVDSTLLHLSLIKGIGPATINQIIEGVAGPLDTLYSYSHIDFMAHGLSLKTAEMLYKGLKNREALDKERELIARHSIQLIILSSSSYPQLLKHIYNPPALLYVRGQLPAHESCMAIVGARAANYYGKEVVGSLVPQLVANDWAIVSGGAIGADTFAHQATLKSNGQTIAILGSGLLRPYPHSNKRLFEEIVATGGALVSSFPLLTDPNPGNFPARNRIIAGMSRGCIVVQAKEKSGARITAQWALEQGRDVFAVPGLISEPLSAGCHGLIAEGAKIINGVTDILVEYGQDVKKTGQVSVEKLSSAEEAVLVQCAQPIAMDELIDKTGLSLRELQAHLCNLQLKQLVEQNLAGLWWRI